MADPARFAPPSDEAEPCAWRTKAVPPKLIGVAAISSGLVLNPLLVARILFHAPTAGPARMHAVLWVVGAVLVAFGVLVLVRRVTVGPRLGRLLMAVFATLATVALVVIADRVVGKVAG